jgi:hypothetical protein
MREDDQNWRNIKQGEGDGGREGGREEDLKNTIGFTTAIGRIIISS